MSVLDIMKLNGWFSARITEDYTINFNNDFETYSIYSTAREAK